MNIFDVSGLVVIVTGASGGNGSAISDTLQKLGCIVINADLPDCDITNNNNIDSLLLKARNYNGQINGLINCLIWDEP